LTNLLRSSQDSNAEDILKSSNSARNCGMLPLLEFEYLHRYNILFPKLIFLMYTKPNLPSLIRFVVESPFVALEKST
jgi:hypothetical protein